MALPISDRFGIALTYPSSSLVDDTLVGGDPELPRGRGGGGGGGMDRRSLLLEGISLGGGLGWMKAKGGSRSTDERSIPEPFEGWEIGWNGKVGWRTPAKALGGVVVNEDNTGEEESEVDTAGKEGRGTDDGNDAIVSVDDEVEMDVEVEEEEEGPGWWRDVTAAWPRSKRSWMSGFLSVRIRSSEGV